jgi:hypothetical protein
VISQADSAPRTSVRVQLEVGADYLELAAPGNTQPFRVPFDDSAFKVEYSAVVGGLHSGRFEGIGQALWKAAFSGPPGYALDEAAGRAASTGTSVTLGVVSSPKAPPAARWLPWEVLYDPVRGDFLALKSGWSVVRSTVTGPAGRPFSSVPLRLLVVSFPQPDGQPYPAATQEVSAIQQAIEPVGAVTVRQNPAADAFLSMLSNEPADIVHVIGSGHRDGLRIAGQDPAGFIIPSQAISAALAANERVALVFLSACDTEWIAEAVAGTVGVAVLGHRQQVADHYAAALAESFYPGVLRRLPADIALTEARRALDRSFPGERAWASAFLMTGWPPPVLPAPSTGAHAAESFADARKDARQLAETLHRNNADRTRQLLEIARWSPLEQQLQRAERRLAELDAKGSK